VQSITATFSLIVAVSVATLAAAVAESINESLKFLNLGSNNTVDAFGGQHVRSLLHYFPQLKVLYLNHNHRLGPLGARALAPGRVAATHFEKLQIHACGLGNDGVTYLVPDGQVNRSLTTLNVCNGNIQGTLGAE
jgi:Leucine Rich repeat